MKSIKQTSTHLFPSFFVLNKVLLVVIIIKIMHFHSIKHYMDFLKLFSLVFFQMRGWHLALLLWLKFKYHLLKFRSSVARLKLFTFGKYPRIFLIAKVLPSFIA